MSPVAQLLVRVGDAWGRIPTKFQVLYALET